jgi:hypothetical protein
MQVKTIFLFDEVCGVYKAEVDDDLEPCPHLVNESRVLELSILQEEDDDTWALGFDRRGGACSPYFKTLAQLEEYCKKPGSREEMMESKKQILSRPRTRGAHFRSGRGGK